jgi:hypothetical protein
MGNLETMNLYDEFKASEMYSKLGQRANTMAYMIAHLERAAKGLIVETGTARIEGNWSGDGQSTLVWDWAASHLPYRVKSVDINPEFVETAKKQVHHTRYASFPRYPTPILQTLNFCIWIHTIGVPRWLLIVCFITWLSWQQFGQNCHRVAWWSWMIAIAKPRVSILW